MKSEGHIRIGSLGLVLIRFFLVLLFWYAAFTKLLELGDFEIQLSKSPLTAPYSSMIKWFIPFLEIITGGMLLSARFLPQGLFSSIMLLSGFTAYIIIILNFTGYIPCACGGVLEGLGWREHLIFNLVSLLLAITGMYLVPYQQPDLNLKTPLRNEKEKPKIL